MAQYQQGRAKVLSQGLAGAPTVAIGAAGNVNVGTHRWAVTFVNSAGKETAQGTASAQLNLTAASQVNLSAIPLGPATTTKRRVYRTVAGDTGAFKLVGEIADNTTTTFTDNVADASLGADALATSTYPTNRVQLAEGGDTTGNIKAADLFKFTGENLFFQVSSLVNATEFLLTSEYSGSKTLNTLFTYAVTRDFTPNSAIPELAAGAVDTADVYTRAMRRVDQLIQNQVTPPAGIDHLFTATGPGQVVLAVRGAAAQTADLQQWQDSAAAVLTKITKDAFLAIGMAATAPGDALVLDMAALTAAGQRDSHFVRLTGRAFDTAARQVDWRAFVDVTSNAGASTLTIQSRIDAATFTNSLLLSDAGVLTIQSGQLLLPTGTASLTFGGGPNPAFFWDAGRATMQANGRFSWSNTAGDASVTEDLLLFRDAANILAQRNGTNAQVFRLYETFTDAANYSRFAFVAGVDADIRVENVGVGLARNLRILLAGTSRWFWSTIDGSFNPTTTNAVTLGSASNRPLQLFAGTSGIDSTGDILGASLRAGAANDIFWNGRTVLRSSADGQLSLLNNAGTDFTRLNFGGATASFPALKRLGTDLHVRLADDSAFTRVIMGTESVAGASGQELNIRFATELTTIAAAAFTDTAITIPAKAVVLAVSVRVVTVIPTATAFDVGVAGFTTRYATGVSTAAGSTAPGTDDATRFYSAATAIRITPNATPATATGQVRVTIFYYESVAPTS